MATTTKRNLDELIRRVATNEKFEVKDLGSRWRITNKEGGQPLFLSKRPPQSNTLKAVLDSLAQLGWNEYEDAEQAEKERQLRLALDRAANEAKARRLAEYAAEQAEKQAAQAEHIKEALPKLTANTVDFGTHRKDILTIDGEFARDLLKHNNFLDPKRPNNAPIGRTNRPFDKWLAESYRDQMLNGKLIDGRWVSDWRISHQGMAMDEDGFLLDGQHRLVALLWASEINPDVTITTEMAYDLPAETMDVIDAGKKRRPTDVLAGRGHVNRMVLATATKLLYKFDKLPIDKWYRYQMSIGDMTRTIGENPDLIDAVRRSHQGGRDIPGSAVAVFLYVAERVYRNAPTEDFLYGVKTGFDLPEGDPRAALNRWIRGKRRSRTKIPNDEYLAVLLKAWNYWLMGREMHQMKFGVNEEFPRPIERE